jgi:hypothetical protein
MLAPLLHLVGTPELNGRLQPAQLAVLATFLLDADIAHGGMHQMYENASGALAVEGVRLLRSIGAPRHAAALASANRIVWRGARIPPSITERRTALRRASDPVFAAATEAWNRAEAREGNLARIVARFILRHRQVFFGSTSG